MGATSHHGVQVGLQDSTKPITQTSDRLTEPPAGKDYDKGSAKPAGKKEVPNQSQGFYARLFPVPKKDGQMRCFPFGILSAPRVFMKVMREVIGFLRNKGV
jgi:hypothetical protein